jgi:hypothetical protein
MTQELSRSSLFADDDGCAVGPRLQLAVVISVGHEPVPTTQASRRTGYGAVGGSSFGA